MNGFLILSGAVVVLAVAYQIHISRRVARSRIYSNDQRIIQLIMIWLLPVIGASVCHWMLSDAEADDVASGTHADGGPSARDSEHDGASDGD